MSEENVQVARALYPGTFDLVDLFSSADGPELLGRHIHPDVEAVFEAQGLPMEAANMTAAGDGAQPTVLGLDAYIATWRDWMSVWETPGGDVGGLRKPLDVPVRKGRPVELFFDEAAALKAAGMSG